MKLFLYFEETSCSGCRNQELKHLRDVVANIGAKSIIVLIGSDDGEIKNEFLKIDFLPTYLIFKNDWTNKIDAPILFLMNNSLRTTCVFKPSNNIPLLSLDYYNTITDKFF